MDYMRVVFVISGIKMKKATFAAGCFWGVEAELRKIPGVISTQVGYTGGRTKRPGYFAVSTGLTGHAESVEPIYDPTKVTYERLLKVFWRIHDPTQKNRQGFDFGTQYRSEIFYHDEKQRRAAERSKEEAQMDFDKKIVTRITPASEFHRAEEYHQQYLEKKGLASCEV